MKPSPLFPPAPHSFRGRAGELRTLSAMIQTHHPAKIALVGSGGSGKSTLAGALGHRLARFFEGRIHWFRIGAWDVRTLAAMMALRFGVLGPGRNLLRNVRAALIAQGPTLIVLDNHEHDASTAALLDGLRDTPVSWIITARRSLLGGVTVFPVVPPLVTVGKSPFPRVAAITRLLRWNPVALLVERAWRAIPAAAQRMLGVLAHMGGDHMDVASLAELANAGAHAAGALERLVALRLVQEPMRGRFTLHATVRHAVVKRTEPLPGRLLVHYVSLLEREPARKELEQTHLFAAMDHAQEAGDIDIILRVQRVAEEL